MLKENSVGVDDVVEDTCGKQVSSPSDISSAGKFIAVDRNGQHTLSQ